MSKNRMSDFEVSRRIGIVIHIYIYGDYFLNWKPSCSKLKILLEALSLADDRVNLGMICSLLSSLFVAWVVEL
jgi:hypothetical protein